MSSTDAMSLLSATSASRTPVWRANISAPKRCSSQRMNGSTLAITATTTSASGTTRIDWSSDVTQSKTLKHATTTGTSASVLSA
jgi:hypothetical protein